LKTIEKRVYAAKLPIDIIEMLKETSEKTGIRINFLIEKAVIEYINNTLGIKTDEVLKHNSQGKPNTA